MNSRHLVDPELSMALDVVPDVTVSGERLAAARATIAEMTMAGLEAADPSVSVSEHWAPGFNGGPDVRMVVYRPEGLADRAPVVLQIHGGGYIFGTAELGDPRNRAMARHVGCAVASVDYRLAPETPFPGGLDDCYAGLLWLHRQGAALNLDPDQIAVHGESAGGGIAAALAIMARDLAGPPIRFQMLTYPMLDDRPPQGGRHPYAGEFVWDEASNHYGWQCWLGREPGSPDIPPLAAPARSRRRAYSRFSSANRSSAQVAMNVGGRPRRSATRAGAAFRQHSSPPARLTCLPRKTWSTRVACCGRECRRNSTLHREPFTGSTPWFPKPP
jgi:acetyl esterase/lipase